MKISELTYEQLFLLAEKNPEWMLKHHFIWVLENRPDLVLVEDCDPEWMLRFCAEWLPATISKLIEKTDENK